MFNPRIQVETKNSIINFEIHATVTCLPPNEQMQFWILDTGDNAGTGYIETDNNGNFKSQSGINWIYHRRGYYSPIKEGIYSLGINRKKFQGKGKMTLSVWNNLDYDNKLVNFP
jgi:hypothetical protein